MSEYLQNLNNLKELLKNHAISSNRAHFKIGDLEITFDYDYEGIYEENAITVIDCFSKITLTFYCIDDSINGVYLMPFMKMNGCGSLVPDIIGRIDLLNTFEKVFTYINEHKNEIRLTYNKKNMTYVGYKYATSDISLDFDLFSKEDLSKLRQSNIDFKFVGEIFTKDENECHKFDIEDDIKLTDLNIKNIICCPELIIKFTTHDDIRSKINNFNQQKAQYNENNSTL
jgi:hypothetical protein